MREHVVYMCLVGKERIVSFQDFRATSAGHVVDGLLADASTFTCMEELAGRGTPPVKAIDAALPDRIRLTNTEKQYVGRMVRDALAPSGWQVAGQRRFDGGRQFTSGSWYRRRCDRPGDLPPSLLPAHEAMARAQAMVALFSINDYSVDDYIRDKREEVRREEDR